MHFSRLPELLVVGLSAFTMVEANFVNIEMVARNIKAMVPRQVDAAETGAGSVTGQASTPGTTPGTSTTSTTSSTTTKSDTVTSTPTKSSSTTKSSSSSSTSSTTSSTTSSPTTSDPNTSASLETITHVITTVNSLGQQTTYTTATTSTNTPGLANNGGSGSPQGMSAQTRNTVIGVVVGVGGAIILAGLGFVAWRIWGRKKGPDENDNLMDYNSSVGAAEKPDTGGSASGRTPFQSTLESYHAPTAVNASSNF